MASRHNPDPMLAAAACCSLSLPGTSTRPDACSPVPRNRQPARTCLFIPSDSRAIIPSKVNKTSRKRMSKERACTAISTAHAAHGNRSPRTCPQMQLLRCTAAESTWVKAPLAPYTALKRPTNAKGPKNAAAALTICTTRPRRSKVFFPKPESRKSHANAAAA